MTVVQVTSGDESGDEIGHLVGLYVGEVELLTINDGAGRPERFKSVEDSRGRGQRRPIRDGLHGAVEGAGDRGEMVATDGYEWFRLCRRRVGIGHAPTP